MTYLPFLSLVDRYHPSVRAASGLVVGGLAVVSLTGCAEGGDSVAPNFSNGGAAPGVDGVDVQAITTAESGGAGAAEPGAGGAGAAPSPAPLEVTTASPGPAVPIPMDAGSTPQVADASSAELAIGFEFDSDAEGFELLDSTPPELSTTSVVAWVNNVGAPIEGALIMQVPFSDANQTVRVARALARSVEMASGTLSGEVRLGEGLGETAEDRGLARLFVASEAGEAFGTPVLLVRARWVSLVLDLAQPDLVTGSFDSSAITQIGLEVSSGERIQNYFPATLLLDSVHWR